MIPEIPNKASEIEILERFNVFSSHLLTPTNMKTILSTIHKDFEKISSFFEINKDFSPEKVYQKYLTKKHEGGGSLILTKQEFPKKDAPLETTIIADYNTKGEILGYSSMEYYYQSTKKEFENKPFHRHEQNYQHTIGIRGSLNRIILLNDISKAYYAHYLNSDSLLGTYETKLWNRLSTEEFNGKQLVKLYSENGWPRYQFIE